VVLRRLPKCALMVAMRRSRWVTLLTCVQVTLCQAGAPNWQSVEPDPYPEHYVLNNANPYVSLITADSANQPHQPVPFNITAAKPPFWLTYSGARIFAHAGVGFFLTDRRLRMDFAQPVASLRLEFIAGSGPVECEGVLHYFDKNGVALGIYSTGRLAPKSVHTFSVDRAEADIKWAVAYTAADSPDQFGMLDNLRFSFLPSGTNSTAQAQMLAPLTVLLKSSSTTLRTRYQLRFRASGRTPLQSMKYRIKAPGSKRFFSWTSRGLGKDENNEWSTELRLTKRGRWQVQIQAFDADGNASEVRSLTIRRR